jgi:hypothetical protein
VRHELSSPPQTRGSSVQIPLEASFSLLAFILDRLCGLVVRVLGYRSGDLGSIPGTTRFSGGGGKENSSGPGTGSTQPREYN